MAVGVYLRVSTEEQRERQSIATQRDFAGRYTDLHQLPIHAMYADDGVTGTIPLDRRPEGARLLRDARLKKFDQLLVYKLDRLGRETRLTLEAVAELEKYGVRVRSMTEEFDSQTPIGRLMITMLSGFAAHEREVIRERSMAGTERKAEAGVWLGGITPYGYHKEGMKGQSHLVINEEAIPGFELSEAEVIRTIYRMCAKQKKSCQRIADHFNRIGLPCGSAAHTVSSQGAGKRKRRIAKIWRPAHVGNLIRNRTYMGQHVYGKRSNNRNRKTITRSVPAIVSEKLWKAAQKVLQSNQIMCPRNRKHSYLLRGLIKCGLCGLTFSGITLRQQNDHYYRCNGRQMARGLYGLNGKKCPAKAINGGYVERLVWADIEAFLCNPGDVLERLRDRLSLKDEDRKHQEKELKSLTGRLEQKTAERERMLGLFRRGRIDEAALDQQLDAINTEAAGLQSGIEAAERALSAEDRAAQLRSAESLLSTLRTKLAGTISPELKRRIVEILVENVQANTVERFGVQQSEITIEYRFSQPNEPAALVLPRSHRLGTRSRIPEKLETIGDHLLRRRLTLKLLQRQVAKQIEVNVASIVNWENNLSKPKVSHMPAIIRFLGYNPLPPSNGWAERLVQARTAVGLTQREAAGRIGVDQCTLARWERSEREPTGAFAKRASHFLTTAEATLLPAAARTA
jgi:site-specific DNA recombinase